MNGGWKCPGCGYCYAPIQLSCANCNRPDHEKTGSTATLITGTSTACPHTSWDGDICMGCGVERKGQLLTERA